jgi:hypothetical protein
MTAEGTRFNPVPAAAVSLVHHAPSMVTYAVLTVLLTWPLVTAPGAWAPHDAGDPLLSTWALWWNAAHVPFTASWWNGAVFYPAPGVLALSDHRVGIGLITTPLILGGVTPLAAHNVAFLLSYFLSAVSANALAYSLTRSVPAAFIAGLVYGFHPFRSEHLPHLELLSSYWLPLVLLALHRWVITHERRWLMMLVAALLLVAFTTGYYFFFLGVLIGLWLLWFVPWNLDVRRYRELAAALLVPFIPLAPVLLAYRAIHQQYGLGRSITEIEDLSADVRGWITAPEPLLLWNAPTAWRTPEGAVFPGLTASFLVAVAVWVAWRAGSERSRPSRLRTALLVLGGAALGVALVPVLWGPVELSLGAFTVSVSQAYKPLSVATLLFLGWGLTSLTFRRSLHAHAVFAFYVLATLAMAVFALGPTARLAGERVLYKAPYSWLMLLPGFADGFRAPARFAMLVALCLSVAAALAFFRVTRSLTPLARTLAACAVSLGVLADSWVYPFPLAPPPPPLVVPHQVPADAAVLELPMGIFEDAAAMYHATEHGRPTVNGLSGYAPPYHAALKSAIRDGDTGVLEVVARDHPLAVFVSRSPATAETMRLLPLQSRARHVASTATHEVFLLSAASRAPAPMPDGSRLAGIADIQASTSAGQIDRLRDGSRRTSWIGDGPQRGGEEITIRLHPPTVVSGVVLAQGALSAGFPRQLTISASTDGATWRPLWQGPTGARTVAAALDDPLDVRVFIEFPPVEAHVLRLTQTGTAVEDEWAVAELSVVAGR